MNHAVASLERVRGPVPSSARSPLAVNVNDILYRWPIRPVVVVCIDGGDPAYLQRYLAEGTIPRLAGFIRDGFAAVADGSMPSFTCPNNVSLITGTPTSRHGISGNFYLDVDHWQPVVMTEPELMRCDSILTCFANAGARVVSITAKEKLRRQLTRGLVVSDGHVSFSAEQAECCTLAEHGIEQVLDYVGLPRPGMYSMELSLFVLQAGLKLMRDRRPTLMYLSLTDWVQHKWAPHESPARDFYQRMDHLLGQLADCDVTLAITADHGMSDKSNAVGDPNVIWLQDLLDARFGEDETLVVCPITDAYVAHHGALGGLVRIWSRGRVRAEQIIDHVAGIDGIDLALDRATACRMFDMPADREGDVVVISRQDVCLGGSAARHDLSGLAGHRLRTHGGTTESKVPFILSRPLAEAYRLRLAGEPLKSLQIFDYAINGTR